MGLLRNDTQLIVLQAILRRLELRRALRFRISKCSPLWHLLECGSENPQKVVIVLPAEQSQCQQIQ